MIEIANCRVLVLAPHTDDGELGCGATIAKLAEAGCEIHYVAFSICEESVPDGFAFDALKLEVQKATMHLGIARDCLHISRYPVRRLNFHRQDILEHLIKLRAGIDPELVFLPSSCSLHQDHFTVYQEGLRAFKHRTCLGYDLPWDNTVFPTTVFVELERSHVQRKWEAIELYETQAWRGYCDREFIFAQTRVRGAQIAKRHAEAFEAIRMVTK